MADFSQEVNLSFLWPWWVVWISNWITQCISLSACKPPQVTLGTLDFAAFHKSLLSPCPWHLCLCELYSPLTPRLVLRSAMFLLFFSGFGKEKKKEVSLCSAVSKQKSCRVQLIKCQWMLSELTGQHADRGQPCLWISVTQTAYFMSIWLFPQTTFEMGPGERILGHLGTWLK